MLGCGTKSVKRLTESLRIPWLEFLKLPHISDGDDDDDDGDDHDGDDDDDGGEDDDDDDDGVKWLKVPHVWRPRYLWLLLD